MILALMLLACTSSGVDEGELEDLRAQNQRLQAEQLRLEAEVAELGRKLAEHEAAHDAAHEAATTPVGDPDPVLATAASGPRCTEVDGGAFRLQGELDTDTVSRSMRVIPHQGSNGELDGMRLSGIRPGSLVATCGFKNGDVVRAVSGHDITGMDAALEAYTALKDETSLRFEVQRRGASTVVEVQLVP